MKKFIDEKGRILGKINIVDLAVIVVLVALVLVIGVRLVSSKMNANGKNPLSGDETVYVTLFSSLVVPEVAENIKVGDKLVANNHFTTGEVVSVKSEPANYVANNSEGRAVKSEHPLWKDVTIVIKDKVDPSSVVLKAGEQEVRVGYSYIFKTQTVETNCKIRAVEIEGLEEETEVTTQLTETPTAVEAQTEAVSAQ